jgi:hypothetical protein
MSGTCYAANQIIEIPELDLSINIPENYLVITRDSPITDEVASEMQNYGISAEELQNTMETKDLYLGAIDNNHKNKIGLFSTDVENSPELKNYDEAEIESMIDSLSPENDQDYLPTSTGSALDDIKIGSIEKVMINNVLYIVCDFTANEDGSQINTKNYFTITRNHAITIKLISYNGTLTQSQNDVLSSIVNSIAFSSAESNISSQPKKTLENTLSEAGYKALIGGIAAAVINLIFWPIEIIRRKRRMRNIIDAYMKSNENRTPNENMSNGSQQPETKLKKRAAAINNDISAAFKELSKLKKRNKISQEEYEKKLGILSELKAKNDLNLKEF